MNRNDVNLSGNSDEYSVLDFQKQSTKREYTRSQIIEFGNVPLDHCTVALNPKKKDELARSSLKKRTAFGLMIDAPKENTSTDRKEKNLLKKKQDTFEYEFPINADSKVDRWLNSGHNPTEHATESDNLAADPIQISDLATATNDFKFADSSLMTDVSTKSSLRSKLLDKTAKLKENLRNKTQNKN